MTPPISGALPIADILQSAAGSTSPTSELVDDFARRLEAAPALSAADSGEGFAAVSRAVLDQDSSMRRTRDQMMDMTIELLEGNDAALDVGRQVAMYHQIARSSFQFNAAIQVAQSAKNGLQTLMRNQ